MHDCQVFREVSLINSLIIVLRRPYSYDTAPFPELSGTYRYLLSQLQPFQENFPDSVALCMIP